MPVWEQGGSGRLGCPSPAAPPLSLLLIHSMGGGARGGGDISRDLHALTLQQGHVLPQWSSDTFASKLLATEG